MSVKTLRARLSEDDVRRLVKGQTQEDRALAARKICLKIDRDGLSQAERQAADEVLQIMAHDAAAMVRRALAITLKNSPHLPREIAQRLADDIDAIATPIIENSPVLEDEDLIAIVRAGSSSKQVAVAGRARIAPSVVRAIAAHGAAPAVERAAANDGAEFDEDSYVRTLERFGDSPAITDALIDRSALPVAVSERLVALVADEALQRLVSRHALPPQLAVELAEGARERATIDILDQAHDRTDMRRFVQQLLLNGRLTPSLVLRGVCMGKMTFFEHAIAELAGVPHEKTWLLIHDAGPLGLRAIFERAGLPQRLFAAVRAAIDVYHDLERTGDAMDRARFTKIMIERVLTAHQGISRDELDYLMDKLNALETGERASDAA